MEKYSNLLLNAMSLGDMAFIDKPKLGIFWFDPVEEELFLCQEVDPSTVNFYQGSQGTVKTISTLHKRIWQKQRARDAAKGRMHSIFVQSDYTDLPRGRIFQYEDNSFRVMVGSWIEQYPLAKDLIIEQFNLPPDVQFSISEHWEIGHGWDEL